MNKAQINVFYAYFPKPNKPQAAPFGREAQSYDVFTNLPNSVTKNDILLPNSDIGPQGGVRVYI